MNRRALFLVFISAVAVWLTASTLGCKSKKSLDGDVDHLLTAIAAANYEHFKADAHPALSQEVSKEEFDRMAVVLKKLGPLESKSMTSISVKAGAPAEGKYDMRFANGQCVLEIKSLEGKLVGFRFRGPDIERLAREASSP